MNTLSVFSHEEPEIVNENAEMCPGSFMFIYHLMGTS
jgi:hypothetical protein